MTDAEISLRVTTAALALMLRENPYHAHADTVRELIRKNRLILERVQPNDPRAAPDRSYWRCCNDRRLIEEARDSKHELCIALGERLERCLALHDDAEIARMDEESDA